MENHSTNDFQTILHLEEGQYEYKFIVDGQWTMDPNRQEHVTTKEGARWEIRFSALNSGQ